MSHYITLPLRTLDGERLGDATHDVDTDAGMAAARLAMLRAGVADAPIYTGEPGESVRTSLVLCPAQAAVTVSRHNGVGVGEITSADDAQAFIDALGEPHVVALLAAHDLPTEDYADALAVLSAYADAVYPELPTLP